MPHDAKPPVDAGAILAEDARFGLATLRRHGWRIALLFVLVLLPLWAFGELAEDVHEGEVFAFDRPWLELAHAIASPSLDRPPTPTSSTQRSNAYRSTSGRSSFSTISRAGGSTKSRASSESRSAPPSRACSLHGRRSPRQFGPRSAPSDRQSLARLVR